MGKYDESSKCPKCGGRLIDTKYDRSSDEMLRGCERCGHSWSEEPLERRGAPMSQEEIVKRMQDEAEKKGKPTVKES